MEDKLNHFIRIIRECNYDNTYKMALAKAFVELSFSNVSYGNKITITTEEVAHKFLKYYWNQTMFHDFKQSINPDKPPLIISTVKSLIAIYRSKVKHERKTKYSEIQYFLKSSLSNSYNQAIKNIEVIITKDVAWRFNKIDYEIYDDVVLFDKEKKEFYFDTETISALKANTKKLNDLINYRWGLILESFNNSNNERKKIFLPENYEIDKETLLFYESVIDIDKLNFDNPVVVDTKINEIKRQDLDPKERIKQLYKRNRFDSLGFHLYEDRREFELKGIQLFAIKDDSYKVCFKNSNIKSQDQLNQVNEYGIDVHYGSSSGYEKITWDVSKCRLINSTNIENPEKGYFVCEPLTEKDAIDLVNYLVRIKSEDEAEELLVEEETKEKEDAQIIKYNPLKTTKEGKLYRPVLVVVKKKIYKINSWKEAFKIIMFFHCYKAERIEELNDLIDSTNNKDRAYYIRSSKYTEENKFNVKFSPDLYIRNYQNDIQNYNFLNKIRKWTDTFELYILRADDSYFDEELISQKIDELKEKNKYKNGSTKHLLASINGRILSPKEKFYIRIANEFDKATLIGDINISEEEDQYLKEYMKNALAFMIKQSKMYYNDKVFAFGMVRVALKHYASKTFWPYVNQEYGVSISGNYQSIINYAFRNTLLKYEKLYSDEGESNYVQNMCMHAFVCDKCADQLFDYIFEFWRIDLQRSIDNSVDEDGNDLFDILIEEIESNKEAAVQNIMLHTTMALEMNPRGCKNRLRRILKMIDNSYWNNSDYSNSSNRLSKLFSKWVNNKNGLFYKDIKSSFERRKHGKGEKLLSRPNIIFNPEHRSFSLFMPKQILRNCTPEEHPVWRILIDGDEFAQIEPDLIQGKASLYTKECSIDIYKTDIYKQFEILLQSDRTNYYRRTIKNSDCRFFNSKGRNFDLDYDYISKDANIAFVKNDKDLVYLNSRFDGKEKFDSLSDIYIFSAEDGDVFILPNNHAIPVGRILQEGIIGNSRIEGVKAQFNDDEFDISSDRERLFFKASRSQLNGTSIKIYDKNEEIYFGKISTKGYTEFKLDDSVNDIYGYFIDLNEYINSNGIYKIDLSIPGNAIRRYKACYINNFDFSFEGAPYIFEETGIISFPSQLSVCTNNDWEEENGKKYLLFNIDENNKENNNYVENRKLHVDYLVDQIMVELLFDLPVLYWKYKKDDKWMIEKPGDVVFKDVPDRIYIDGNIGLSSAKLYIENDEDLEESETNSIYDNKENAYYFRTIDLLSNLNREKVCRFFNLSINNKDVRFLSVICRSILVSKNLTGDFVNNVIYGNFEIIGSSDFMVSIYYGDEKLEENVPVVDGKFEVECDVKGGTYKIALYELEEDDSGFDSVSFKIDEFLLEIMDASNLEGKDVYIKFIRDRELKYAPLLFMDGYCVKGLKRFDYSEYVEDNDGFYSYLYDSLDEDVINNFYYYSGSFGYYDHLNRFRYIKEALVVFDNRKNLGEALINIIGYDELLPLIFSPNRQQLTASDKGFSKLERLKARTIDDDIYKIEIEIR